MKHRDTVLLPILTVLLAGVGALSTIEAACPEPRPILAGDPMLLGSTSLEPGIVPGPGTLTGAFWHVGNGDPARGAGNDSGRLQALGGFVEAGGGFGARLRADWNQPGVDGCIDAPVAGGAGGRCMAMQLTEGDAGGHARFALLTARESRGSEFVLGGAETATIRLAPFPELGISARDLRENREVQIDVRVPEGRAFEPGFYPGISRLDGPHGEACAPLYRGQQKQSPKLQALIRGVRIYTTSVSRGGPRPTDLAPRAWTPVEAGTVYGLEESATITMSCADDADIYLGYTLVLDSGFETAIVAAAPRAVPCGPCGNGVVDPGEACDTRGETARCDDDCTPVTCGDDNANAAAGEQCDDAGPSASCNDDCTLAFCGDGRLDSLVGEQCDDGNSDDDDGCRANCMFPMGSGGGVAGLFSDDFNECTLAELLDNGWVLTDPLGVASADVVGGGSGTEAFLAFDLPAGSAYDPWSGMNASAANNALRLMQDATGVGSFEVEIRVLDDPLDNVGLPFNGLDDAGLLFESDADTFLRVDLFAFAVNDLRLLIGSQDGGSATRALIGSTAPDGIGILVEPDTNHIRVTRDATSGDWTVWTATDDRMFVQRATFNENDEFGPGGLPLTSMGVYGGNTPDANFYLPQIDYFLVMDQPFPRPDSETFSCGVCGNGQLEIGEECDDGNLIDGDGCDSNCTLTRCGNGIQTDGEECDDGNDVETDACLSTCMNARCGDGFTWEEVEECDDGNNIDTDSCLNSCTAATCGDGVVWNGVEDCDGGMPPLSYVQDGSFEMGAFAGMWVEQSDNFGTPLCDPASCVGVSGASDGQWWAWFGGVDELEHASVSQQDNLPAGQRAILEYDLWLGECSGIAEDYFEVLADETALETISMNSIRCNGPEGDDYVRQSIDLSSYVGQPVTLEFRAVTGTAGVGSNIFVDNVSVRVAGTETEDCNADCTFAECGDGKLNMTAGEECDDGNTTDGDGCSSTCAVEDGYVCIGEPSDCQLIGECGNGVIEGTEACDDGNTVDGDGCSSTCAIEDGYVCDGEPSQCQLIEECGNGVIEGAEACDDGNTVDGDGCSSTCAIEDGYVCTGEPSQCQLIEECGNGVIEGAEACDDGNTTDGDGCSSTCAIEDGYVCTGEPSQCQLIEECGNGVIEGAEACDDGNTVDGDGCSSTCAIEDGYVCDGEPSQCQLIEECGNGVIEGTEACDDGNTTDGDGCSSTCAIEDGYVCDGEPSQCQLVEECGNGVIEGTEACDDGNTTDGDGCSSTCAIEDGYVCTGEPSQCQLIQECGNGVIEGTEACDDGNTTDGDGCSSTCAIEDGYVCTGEPSQCQLIEECGNGVIEGAEACDDGNTTDGDGCSSICAVEDGYVCTGEPSQCQLIEECGNGVIEGTEACDDGNTTDGDGCSSTCAIEDGYVCDGEPSQCQLIEECGNGVIEGTEACDDGNTTDGDGCSSTCAIEDGYVCTGEPSQCQLIQECGNGVIEGTEACDDGNTTDGDGCSSTCAIEDGYVCDGEPSQCQLIEECGNGVIEGTEACDDGNTTDGDGCSSTCAIEDGYVCTGEPSQCQLIQECGNGVIEGTEACDDGNTTDGDGCSSTCAIEDGYVCDGEPSQCQLIEECGNGVIEGTEACDDGNTTDGDGCSSTCAIEDGYVCTGEPSQCQLIEECGNGVIEGTEACDDGNTTDGDGCSSTCAIEDGYVCTGEPSQCQLIEECGNGVIEGAEACDDGNTTDGDGCSSICAVEDGYVCTGEPSQCQLIEECGNGVIEGTEACDDGNTTDGDGCSSTCAIEDGYVCDGEPSQCQLIQECGNGVIEGTEACDDGNTTDGDGCSSTCAIEDGYVCDGEPSECQLIQECGNGVIEGTEACDDGNTTDGDGCSSTCTIEDGYICTGQPSECMLELFCGNGVIDLIIGEQCDDANLVPGDGCENDCTLTDFIVNGDFANRDEGWVGFFEAASGTFEVQQGQAEVSITADEDNQQLYQAGIALHPATTYELSFRAASGGGEDMKVRLIQHEAPFATAGIRNKNINLMTPLQSYSLVFTTPAWHPEALQNLRVLFWFADNSPTADFVIDDVRLVEKLGVCGDGTLDPNEDCDLGAHNSDTPDSACRTTCRVPFCGDSIADSSEQCDMGGVSPSCNANCTFSVCGDGVLNMLAGEICDDGNNVDGDGCPADCGIDENLVTNPGFDALGEGWLFYSDVGGNNFSVPDGEACVRVQSAGDNIQLLQAPLLLEGDTAYELSFDARSTNGNNVRIQLFRDVYFGENYGLDDVADLTMTEARYVIPFRTTPGDKIDARLTFQFDPFDSPPNTTYLDNIVLRKLEGDHPAGILPTMIPRGGR